ncbi:MAG: tRNA (adenosine(37)-N6)-threonylcarbamoyltransferase complex dimerization subunit type 1 TsaB, partial [Kangiellaceae bacterium]|nr:tRNA (adenosine(37)-N6)-threonylcarbamoyltransferase complex dimerization subunit type 1 TsaB [Kangiellaceae bacterium]
MTSTIALETSTEGFSVAIEHKGAIAHHSEVAPRQHAAKLLPTITELQQRIGMTRAEPEHIVYGCGPGAFTGVRIAVSAAQGLGVGYSCSLIAISTLQNLAAQAFNRSNLDYCLAVIDARMGEVYCALYQRTDE